MYPRVGRFRSWDAVGRRECRDGQHRHCFESLPTACLFFSLLFFSFCLVGIKAFLDPFLITLKGKGQIMVRNC